MTMTRRSMLAACASACPALAVHPGAGAGAAAPADSLGLVIHSFPVHQAQDPAKDTPRAFADPIRFVEYCRNLGVRCVQVGLGIRDKPYVQRLRDAAQAGGTQLEGITALPQNERDLERFEAELSTARAAGAEIVRTVTLSGRRYETFDSAERFERFRAESLQALKLAAPCVRKHRIHLAVENHKDWRADELIRLLDAVGCDELGVCLDTGNSISLLEDPMEVIEQLAPRALTTHFKDMALEETRDGFLLSEVPLGEGILDLPRAVSLVRKARPSIRFHVEMITRDPLSVPCLTTRYWATFPELPGRHLARTLALVRAHPPARPLPRISRLGTEEQMRQEDGNVARCLEFARRHLDL